ncbi:MAG: CoA transferase, partial [Proteobacteria bacterium]|nr:CoA transferase [Pseudomonadota bacterium]
PEITEEVAAIFVGRSRDEWTEFWAVYDACCEPVLSLPEAVASPLVRERGMVEPLDQGVQLACPLKMSGSPQAPTAPPPALGQDTMAVLAGLGLSQAEIENMAGRGVVGLA